MTNITGADSFDELFATPDEGEEMTAVAAGVGKGPVRPGFQAAMNRTASLHELAILQSLVPRFCISADGTDNKIKIALPGRVAGTDANGKRWMIPGTNSPFTIGPDSQAGAPAIWPANAIMYVYCYATTAGALGIETASTAPTASLLVSSGDPTRRYLGCFLTGAGPTPFPVEMSGERGSYRYITPQVTTALGTDAVYTAVTLTGLRPPHARRVYMYLHAVGDTTGPQDIYLKPGPGSGEVVAASAPKAVAGTANTRVYVDIPTIDGTLAYKVSGASVSSAGLYVAGWTE